MKSITDSLPRTSLAYLPTPIEPLPRLSALLGGPDLLVKRDDQTGLATGGNKTRKLEYLIADALIHRADSVVSAGSTQSNHARQTAAAAAKCGLECYLALYAPDGNPPEHLNGNALLCHLLGATIHWTTEKAPYTEAIQAVKEELETGGKSPYIIPYGGSNVLGMMGYVSAMEEIATQITGDQGVDAIVFATSSGGTQAGMLLGAQVSGLLGKVELHGISVDEHKETLAPRVLQLARDGAELLELEWNETSIAENLIINEDYLGGGYAVIGEAEREAIRLLSSQEGLLVDPVYTGRAFAGLLGLIRSGYYQAGQRVLFWHTGGSAAIFAFADELQG